MLTCASLHRCIPVLVRVAVIGTTSCRFCSYLPSLIHPPVPVHSLSLRMWTSSHVNELVVLFITETWHSDQGVEVYSIEMTPKGYQFHSFPRCSRMVGGIALVSECSPKSLSVKRLNYQCLEAVQAKLLHSSKSMSDPLPAKLISSWTKCFLVTYLVTLLTWQAGQERWWL